MSPKHYTVPTFVKKTKADGLMLPKIIDVLGWVGVGCCTLGYLLLSTNTICSTGWKYQTLNTLGGTFLVMSAISNHDAPNMVANGLWALIGLTSIFRRARPILLKGSKD